MVRERLNVWVMRRFQHIRLSCLVVWRTHHLLSCLRYEIRSLFLFHSRLLQCWRQLQHSSEDQGTNRITRIEYAIHFGIFGHWVFTLAWPSIPIGVYCFTHCEYTNLLSTKRITTSNYEESNNLIIKMLNLNQRWRAVPGQVLLSNSHQMNGCYALRSRMSYRAIAYSRFGPGPEISN